MAICSLLAMSWTQKLGFAQPVSTFGGFSVSRDFRRIRARGFTRGRCRMIEVGARKPGDEVEESGIARDYGTQEMFKVGQVFQDCASNTGALEAPLRRFSLRIWSVLACPALVAAMFDWSAAAVESEPISTAMKSDSAFPIEILHRFALIGDLDPRSAQLATSFLGPLIAIFNLLFILRIVMSWYPGIPVNKFPFFIAYNPTEPVLGPTRRLIPPVGGVDIAPVIWVALMSFANEVLLGKQGLLVLLSQQQP